jgi:endogenous inhibitor of DNA gyrase (YacG/DUF329 family)
MKTCLNCGKEIEQKEGKRERKFCGDVCRATHFRQKNAGKKKYVKIETYEKLQKELEEERKRKPAYLPVVNPVVSLPKDYVEVKKVVAVNSNGEVKSLPPENTDAVDRAMEIAQEMKKIQMEKIPPERDKSTMGRKSWAIEQKKKLADLQAQLDKLI